MLIGERIKQLREANSLTQEELAKRLETSKQTIYKYENQVITNIPSDKIELLAKIFNVSPIYLMGWDEVGDVSIEQNNNNGNISNNVGTGDTYNTNNYYSGCDVGAVNRAIPVTIDSKEYFFCLLDKLRNMTDSQLLDMIKYADFIISKD